MTLRLSLLLILASSVAARTEESTGPWDVKALQPPPKVTWVDETGPVRKLYYESEPLAGKPTRVFAYLASPDKVDGKVPAMVLVHGGGGTAFREWAELWAKRGYIALAMDLAGCGPDRKRLPDGMPDQSDVSKVPREPKPIKEVWTYHSVAAVIRGVSLLANLPDVDANKIGITGISWGGYLTCIVMGLDDRLKVAVPVYGCGFLHENSVWKPTLDKLPPAWRDEWVKNFDPLNYAGRAKMPVLFVNGTNDFAYPLDSYQKTYRLVKNRTLMIKVNLPHGHPQGWAPIEIGLFVDQHLKRGKGLPEFDHQGPTSGSNGKNLLLNVPFGATRKVELHYTRDASLPWQKRKWQTEECTAYSSDLGTFTFLGPLPKDRPLVCFLTVSDDRGVTVSTEHVMLEK